jgi:hypothetical protein
MAGSLKTAVAHWRVAERMLCTQECERIAFFTLPHDFRGSSPATLELVSRGGVGRGAGVWSELALKETETPT